MKFIVFFKFIYLTMGVADGLHCAIQRKLVRRQLHYRICKRVHHFVRSTASPGTTKSLATLNWGTLKKSF